MSYSGKHSGHRKRMRQRFLETSIDGFQPHEIIEILLYYSIPCVNTNVPAHNLIDTFNNSLSDVLNANEKDIAAVKGIGTASASFLNLVSDLCRGYAAAANHSSKLSSLADIEKFAFDYFHGYESEATLFISLSNELSVIDAIIFPIDELDLRNTEPRTIAEIALRNNMHRIAAVRYYPGKRAVPSNGDFYSVKFLTENLAPLGIEVCDYVVCGSFNAFSMKKSGAFSFY